MTIRYLTDNAQAANYSEKRIRIIDLMGVVTVLPAAMGVLCAIARVNLSVLSLAAITVLFLVCIISSLTGILTSFWMRPSRLAWSVRLTGIAWLGVCAYIAVAFVLQLAGFSGR